MDKNVIKERIILRSPLKNTERIKYIESKKSSKYDWIKNKDSSRIIKTTSSICVYGTQITAQRLDSTLKFYDSI